MVRSVLGRLTSDPGSRAPVETGDPARIGGAALPRTEADIVRAAHALDLVIPETCMPGVIANLALLDTHAAILLDRTVGDDR